jgi:Cys-tRNA(Pro)/Cys-tRNA(Cys) deacylase
MAETPQASRVLADLGIPHAVFRHAHVPQTLEQAARERGQRPQQVVRSLVFRLGARHFIMVLVAGGRQVSWKRLRERIGQRRLSLATSDEVLSVSGYRIGAVSPFGLPQSLRVLVDRSVLLEARISIGSGDAGAGILMNSQDLLRALPGAELVDLATPA